MLLRNEWLSDITLINIKKVRYNVNEENTEYMKTEILTCLQSANTCFFS